MQQKSQQESKQEPQQWFTREEAAEHLRISTHTINRYVKLALLPYYILPLAEKQPRKRYKREDLEKLLTRKEVRKK